MVATRRRCVMIGACAAILMFARLCASEAADPGYELAKACRSNLNMLREATEKCIKSGVTEFPTWAKLQDVRTMLLTSRFLPQQPKPPTLDCEYYLVFKDPQNFDWYCNLHGLVGGDQSTTFRYHEFQFTAYTSSKYMGNPKYKTHADNLLRWVSYEPTVVESFKYHYARNPMTTLIIAGIGLLFCLYIFKNIFY